jgi:hypothetical protein
MEAPEKSGENHLEDRTEAQVTEDCLCFLCLPVSLSGRLFGVMLVKAGTTMIAV